MYSQTASPIRAVVVDDSSFMRTVIGDMLGEGGIDVIAEAEDGEQAIEVVTEHRPDVVTMDIEMPRVNGVEAVERIMKALPTPILVLSAHAGEGADVTFEALENGAVDFFTKPGGEVTTGMPAVETQLCRAVRSVAAADLSGGTNSQVTVPSIDSSEYKRDPTIVIGASTGGPGVVERVLSELPIEADARVLVVQHMPDGFTARFAERLDSASDYSVREATNGARIGGGEALLAKGGSHMRVRNDAGGRLRVSLTDDPPEHNVRPAVDVTMKSAAETVTGPLTGVILTGMGRDGAAGTEAIKGAGGRTVAQDESSSAVYGMPRRATETGAVDIVSGIEGLALAITETISEGTA
jgi:two-component system chemotaxis response regulator CheB